MATLDDLARIAAGFPGVTEGERYGHRTWVVGKQAFAWERPFSKADLKRYGDEVPPEGPIAAVSTGDLAEKEAILAAHPGSVFTIPHFDGYAAVLVDLPETDLDVLAEVLEDAWLACAPPSLVDQYLAATEG